MREKTFVLLCLFLLILLLIAASEAKAQSGGDYALSWFTINSGGRTTISNDSLEVVGTIGQSDIGESYGADFIVLGGWWPREKQGLIFWDGFESGDVELWSSSVNGGLMVFPASDLNVGTWPFQMGRGKGTASPFGAELTAGGMRSVQAVHPKEESSK